MKIHSITLFFCEISFIFSSVPNWDLESLSVDLFSSSSSDTQYEYILYESYGYVLKKIVTRQDGKIKSVNKLTFTEDSETYTQEVAFENIESTYYQQLDAKRLVCPRGKFHPYNLGTNSYIVPSDFVEEGNWDLSCYKHDTGYFIIFYTNNGDYSAYFKKGDNAIKRTMAVSFDFFAYKLPDYTNKGHNYKYRLPSIRESGGNLILSGYTLTMNEGESQINGQEPYGTTVLTQIKSNTRAAIDNNYYFYYFTYNDVSDFTSGYSNTYINLENDGSNFASSFSSTKNADSPLSFVDNVEIIDMNFIPGTHDVYYKIYNKDKNTTYCGLIDVKENKVIYNIEADDVTFIPDSSGHRGSCIRGP